MVAVPAPSGDGPDRDATCTTAELRDVVVALVKTARRLSPGEAEDLVQEAMTRAVAHGVAPDALPWLRTVIRHLVIDKSRRAQEIASGDSSDMEEMAAGSEPTPEDHAMRCADRAMVREALARMPSRYREALLAIVEDADATDVARRFGLSPEAAWSLLSRARRRLRLELKRAGYVPAAIAGRFNDLVSQLAPAGVAIGVAVTIPLLGGSPRSVAPAEVRPEAVHVAAAHAWPASGAQSAGLSTTVPGAAAASVSATGGHAAGGARTVARYGADACVPGESGGDWTIRVGARVVDDDQPSPTGGSQSVTVDVLEELPEDVKGASATGCGG